MEMIRRILEAYRIPVLAQPGFEADDFLASVAAQALARKVDVYLCTADKDIRQAINDHACIYDMRRNRIINREYLEDDWGILPEQVVDFQAMVGDSTDNIPGIAGVGPKTAAKLLKEFGTLDGVYANLDRIAGNKLCENLRKGRESAIISRELVRLRTDVPLPNDWSEWRVKEPDRDRLLALFAECGFRRLATEILAEKPTQIGWQARYQAICDKETFAEFLTKLARQSRISLDLETTSIHPREAEIVGYAFSWLPGEAYYVAVRGPRGETALEPDEVLTSLRPIIENPEIEKVGQNLKYDMVVLRSAGVELRGLAFDTMVASYLLEPGERNHSLDDLSRRLLGHETIKITELIGKPGKSGAQRRMDEVPVHRVAEYAGEDADVALRLAGILEPRLKEESLDRLYLELECPLVEVLAAMECRGVRVDRQRLLAQSREYGRRLAELEAQAHELAGQSFNLESPTQLRTILFDDLKLPIIKRTKTGPSTDQEVLEELADRHPLCALLLEHRQLSKLKGTYLDALPGMMNAKTGRIHASFNQTVAATGRLSSSDPNLQNIPVRTAEGREIRRAFLPGGDGQVLLSADYSQIELRLLAHYSGDANLRRAFAQDEDIHAAVAARIAGIPLDAVTPELRRRAKAVNFGIMYGLSPFGLARQLGIDKSEAAAFIDAYFEQYPGIDGFITDLLSAAQKQGFVRTILGRRRPISGIKSVSGRNRNLPERTAINTVIQGSAADLIKKAMIAIHRRLESEDYPAAMLLQIHDELVFEADSGCVPQLATMVNDEMTGALELTGVPLKVDIGVGPNWLDLVPREQWAAIGAGP
jgi:DNA polymerase-1